MLLFCCLRLKRNIRNFWFSDIASFLLKYKTFFNLRARKFYFLKFKKLFKSDFFYFSSSESYFPKYKRNIRVESSIFGNTRKFLVLSPESALDSYFCRTFHHRYLTVFWICLVFWIYQGTEYTSSSKYAMVLNMPFPKFTKVPFPEN